MTARWNHIPGPFVTVERNGSEVTGVKSVRFTREADKISPSWSVELRDILNIDPEDTWTIKWGFAGAQWTLVEDALSEAISGEDGGDLSTRSVSSGKSSAEVSDLREYCTPKTLCFVNPDWLQEAYPRATVVDGVIRWPGASGVRVYHPRLPDQSFNEGTFECILACKTHQDAARYLANRIGYDLVVNTPDVTIIDTLTIASGTTWGSAITGLFSIWGPVIRVLPAKTNGKPTIQIIDVVNGEGDVVSSQIIQIDNPAIISTSLSDNRGGQREIVDHLIVTGRKTKGTFIGLEERPDFTEVELSIEPLTVDEEYTASRSVDETVVRNRTWGTFDGTFWVAPGKQNDCKRIKTQEHIVKYHVVEKRDQPKKRVLVEEETRLYNVDDTMVGKTVIKHGYSADLRPVKTVEEEWLYTSLPGSSAQNLVKCRTKTTLQDRVVKPTNTSLTHEFIEEKILFTWQKINGIDYRTNPQPLADMVRRDYSKGIIDSSSGTKQDTLDMVTHTKETMIDRNGEDSLIKRDFDYDILSQKSRMNSQILDNPIKNKPKVTTGEEIFRQEYFDGSGEMIGGYGPCYHSPKTVNHDDIDRTAISDLIAERVFARKNTNALLTVTVKSPVPIPLETMDVQVRLTAFSKIIDGATQTIPQADYVLKSENLNFDYEGEGNQVTLKIEQQLTVRSKY